MKRLYFFISALLVSAMVFAQNTPSADVNIDVTESSPAAGNFPWMWVIIGAIVLILLIVILSSGGGGRDRVVEKRTVIKD